MKTFYTWLKQFKREDSAWGDLARDSIADLKVRKSCRPKNSRDSWLEHLHDCHACNAAIDTFESAWEAYSRQETQA